MIPKILTFIWLGDVDIPQISIKSWEKYHPDFEIKIITEKDIESLKLINYDSYKCSKKRYNQKSDIIRYEILYKYGGFYIDADIICIKRIPDDVLNKKAFLNFEKKGLISNSVIGCEPGNSLMYKLIDNINKNYDYNMTVWKCTGPLLLTNMVMVNNEDCLYPPEYFNIFSKFSNKLLLKNNEFDDFLKNDKDVFTKKNRDMTYDINVNNIIGVQLWFGGKPSNYKKFNKNNQKRITKNIKLYIEKLRKNNTSSDKFNLNYYRTR